MGFMVTVGAYAAAFPSGVTVKALAGSDYVLVTDGVDGPPSIGWTLTNGMIDGAKVTWKPDDTGNFKIKVKTKPGASNGNDTVAATAGVQQTDIIPMSPSVDPKDVGTVQIVISEK